MSKALRMMRLSGMWGSPGGVRGTADGGPRGLAQRRDLDGGKQGLGEASHDSGTQYRSDASTTYPYAPGVRATRPSRARAHSRAPSRASNATRTHHFLPTGPYVVERRDPRLGLTAW